MTGRTVRAVVVVVAGVLALSGCEIFGMTVPGTEPAATSAAVATPTVTPTATATSTPSATPTVTASATASMTPTPTPTTSATPTPSATPSASPKPTVKPRTTLQFGDKGASVLALQKELSALGYWLGTPDGSFGNQTLQAVYALQKAAGIGRDGEVGPATKRALANKVRPRSVNGGNGVEIDLDRQLLLIVRDGSVRTILNTSTGNGQPYISSYGTNAVATTPRGSYAVYRAVDGEDKGKLGVLWRPRYFNGGIAVHGAGSVPPWPASHGCARVSNAAMNHIWANNLMPMGSRVVVR